MQNNQHGCLHSWGATEGQDEAHGAPDPEADEYERNQDQLLISCGGAGPSLQLAPLTDGPVFRERLVLCGEQGAKTRVSRTGLLPDHLCTSNAHTSRGRQGAGTVVFSIRTRGGFEPFRPRGFPTNCQLPDHTPCLLRISTEVTQRVVALCAG